VRLPFGVVSPWFNGQSDILTFSSEELVATKIRALHQRRKGRDLFDLWLALTQMGLEPAEIVACFAPYRPEGYTREAALETFDGHVAHAGFRGDLSPMMVDVPAGYDIDDAAELIRTVLLERP